MACEAALQAMDDAGAKTGRKNVIDQVFIGTMAAGMVQRISGLASAVVDTLNLRPAMAETIENGPASGASAVKLGYMAIASGMCDCVLVVGAEGMRAVTGWEGTDFVAPRPSTSTASRCRRLRACSRACAWTSTA